MISSNKNQSCYKRFCRFSKNDRKQIFVIQKFGLTRKPSPIYYIIFGLVK